MSPKRDYYYDDPAHPDGPNYRDTRGWLAGIGIFIVCVLALIGFVTVFSHLIGG